MTKNKPPCIIYLEAWWWALKKGKKTKTVKQQTATKFWK